jgi:uncharacterized damage-inducible protein DinB
MSDDLLTQFSANLQRVQAAFRLPPGDLARSYVPGKWSGVQLLLHIADTESSFLDRLRRALSEQKPLLLALDPDRWTARLGRPFRSLATAEALFSASRTSYIELLASVAADEWARTAVHTEDGMFTVRQIAEKAVWHANHHLAQVEAAAAGRAWVKPA